VQILFRLVFVYPICGGCMEGRRVVITGVGAITPYGVGVQALWNALLEGKSAISHIKSFDTTNYSVKIAGEVQPFNLDEYIDPKEQRRMDRFTHLGMVAADLALKDSGIELNDHVKARTGVFASSGIGGLLTLQNTHSTLLEKGPRRISPMFIPMVIANLLPGHISMKHGLQGPNMSIVTACASGAHCIGYSYWAIKDGKADYMVAGAAESAVCELGIGGFAAMRALSTRNDAPEKASRPWDKDRDGFVMSEGGAVVFLEEYEAAKKRGANIYAEVIGFGMSSDAFHMTQPPENGDGAARCLKAALDDAKLDYRKIDYINAHGTSTPLGDIAEIRAMKNVFKEQTPKINITSSKSMTGHLLGASGSVEMLITAMSMKHGIVTPTINLDNPEPDCEGLNLTPHKPQERKIEYGLSNSFGFGGTNCSVILKRA
jgi:3-oxoacyl-[acyl-carrier-protein] synthase II